MGRVKLKIKKLENTNGRQATYAKRKQGIMKKASELSILCDTDIVLLMFSPTGKPSLWKGLRSNIEEVIGKFCQLTPQERTKRKLESLEALKKTFRKVDHDVNIPELLGTRNQNIEDLSNQATFLKTKVSEIQKRMIYWTEPDKINNIQHLGQMETSLLNSLNQIRLCKENIQKQQLLSLECSDRFNEMHIPFRVSSEQQLQPFSWNYNTENPHVVLTEDKILPVNRDAEFSSSSSYGSHASYIGTGKSRDISPTSHDHALHQLNRTAPPRFQLGGQFPYLPYSVELLNDCKIQPATADINPQENPLNHYFTGSFEAPRSVYGSKHPTWVATSGHCTIPMPDEHLHTQASFL